MDNKNDHNDHKNRELGDEGQELNSKEEPIKISDDESVTTLHDKNNKRQEKVNEPHHEIVMEMTMIVLMAITVAKAMTDKVAAQQELTWTEL